jgi:restriction system protein
MSIPDFQSLMLPLLKLIQDGEEHSISEMFEKLGASFNLTEEDCRELLPSGRQLKFENRVHWAKTFLQKASLIESTGRARFKITKRGSSVLSHKPETINIKFLSQYPEFVEFRKRNRRAVNDGPEEEPKENTPTPLETLEYSYLSLRQSLAQEIIETIKKCPPAFFERLVVDLLIAMGYGGSRKDAGSAIGRTGDGGVDGIIKEDKLGLDVVYIQAKRWNNPVSVSEVQAFAGSLEGFRARKGVMITTSKFTQRANEFIDRIEKKIVLIDGEQLAQLMIDYNIGVSEVDHYVVKRIDLDYFDTGA